MLRFLICLLAVTLCMSGGCAPAERLNVEPPIQTVTTKSSEEKITRLLILGCDRAAGLTDSILILTVNETTGELSVLQLPRDTYAEYTDRDYKKLNGAYAVLGMGGVKDFLSDTLGVPLDYAVTLDLDCVSRMVDAVGGVEVEITQPMQYSDPAQGLNIDLQPGLRRLNGREAEHFLRFRSGYANADLGRMDAQKRFIAAFASRCRELGAGAELRILWELFPNMETDLPIHRAIALIRAFPDCRVDAISMATAPGAAVQGTSGAWYYSLNRAGMIRAVEAYLLPSHYDGAAFDPMGRFHREEHPEFHQIYTAPDGGA